MFIFEIQVKVIIADAEWSIVSTAVSNTRSLSLFLVLWWPKLLSSLHGPALPPSHTTKQQFSVWAPGLTIQLGAITHNFIQIQKEKWKTKEIASSKINSINNCSAQSKRKQSCGSQNSYKKNTSWKKCVIPFERMRAAWIISIKLNKSLPQFNEPPPIYLYGSTQKAVLCVETTKKKASDHTE